MKIDVWVHCWWHQSELVPFSAGFGFCQCLKSGHNSFTYSLYHRALERIMMTVLVCTWSTRYCSALPHRTSYLVLVQSSGTSSRCVPTILGTWVPGTRVCLLLCFFCEMQAENRFWIGEFWLCDRPTRCLWSLFWTTLSKTGSFQNHF